MLFILLLLALSASYSAMETALVSLSDMRLRRLVEESARPRAALRAFGRGPSRMLVRWHDRPNDVLATLLIGNNFVNITASALATDATESLLRGTPYGGWGLPIAVGITTMVVLIAGEVVPKTYAKHNPEKVLHLLPLITLSYALFYPVMRVLVRLTGQVVRRLGGATEGAPSVTDQDIADMVRIGTNDGSVSPNSAKLLTGIFDLDDKIARGVMVPRTEVHGLPVDAGLADVMQAVKEHGHSRFPVYKGAIDNIVGVLYIKDYFQAALARERSSSPRVSEVLRRPMVRPWNMPVQDLFRDMQKERVHMAIIASEYGGVAGIVTLEDIIEEVFGPIYDEHDRLPDPIREQPDGGLLVDGVVALSELEKALGTDFPDDDEATYETVAGLLMTEAGRVPEAGFACDYHGFRFEVVAADALHVRLVMVRALHVDVAPAAEAS